MRAPGRISTACEYPGDGGSASDLIKRTEGVASLIFRLSFTLLELRVPEKIAAAKRNTTTDTVRIFVAPINCSPESQGFLGTAKLSGATPFVSPRMVHRDGKLNLRQRFARRFCIGFDPIDFALGPMQPETTGGQPAGQCPVRFTHRLLCPSVKYRRRGACTQLVGLQTPAGFDGALQAAQDFAIDWPSLPRADVPYRGQLRSKQL